MNTVKKKFLCLPLLFGFILGCHRGYIALWNDGGSEPAQIYPYRVDTLPPADQKALQEGIYIKSEKELTQLLEDYLS